MAVALVVKLPALGELDSRAPKALRQRLLDLPAGIGAAAGELVAWDGTTWLLGGAADPDRLGLAVRWIATELTVAASYDAQGRPQVAWNGTSWVPAP